MAYLPQVVMIGNLADLAATGLASEPTLRKWIAAEPDQAWIIKRGSNGDAYEIDLQGAVNAFREQEEEKAREARDRAEQIRQFGLDLGLGAIAADPAAGLSIDERRQLIDEEVSAIKLARLRGELVDRASMEAAFGDVLVKFRQRGATFSARLAKKIDLSRDQIAAIDRLMTSDQAELARLMEQMDLGNGGEADNGAPGAAPALDDPGLRNGH